MPRKKTEKMITIEMTESEAKTALMRFGFLMKVDDAGDSGIKRKWEKALKKDSLNTKALWAQIKEKLSELNCE